MKTDPESAPACAPTAADSAQRSPDFEQLERRKAKHVLFFLAVTPLLLLILVLLLFFQPRDQILVTRHENGYLATRSHSIQGPSGQPLLQGEHEAWYISGNRSERGCYERGKRSGPWHFWSEEGQLLEQRSGVYREGERLLALPEEL